MMKNFVLVLYFILAIACAGALKYDENIEIKGGGTLFAETNSGLAKDSVHGTGLQTYSRNLSQEQTSASLSSKYSLNVSRNSKVTNFRSFKTKKNPEAKWEPHVYSELLNQNTYTIQMRSPNYLVHSAGIFGSNNIESNNTINFKDGKVMTAYDFKGSGVLKESLVDFNTETKPNLISKTILSDTNFILHSGIGDNALLGSDIDRLITWADQGNPAPSSVKEEKLIDPNRGIFGRQAPPNNTSSQHSPDPAAVPTGQPSPGTTAVLTGQPSPGTTAVPTGQPAPGTTAVTTGQSAPGTAAIPTGQSAPGTTVVTTGQPAPGTTAVATGQPTPGTTAVTTGQPTPDGTVATTDQPLPNVRENIASIRMRDATVLIDQPGTNPVPAAYIGGIAQFYFTNRANLARTGTTYRTFYEDGIVVSRSNACDGGLCQNYTHIEADYGYGQPIIAWRSPNTRSLRLVTPPIL